TTQRYLGLELKLGGEHTSVQLAVGSPPGADLRRLIREDLAPLDRETRAQIVEFFVKSTAELASQVDRRRLSRSLSVVRGALREPCPRSLVLRELSQVLNVEAIVALDETSFYVRGWMRDEQAEIVKLTPVSPEGERVSLMDGLFRHRRP